MIEISTPKKTKNNNNGLKIINFLIMLIMECQFGTHIKWNPPQVKARMSQMWLFEF